MGTLLESRSGHDGSLSVPFLNQVPKRLKLGSNSLLQGSWTVGVLWSLGVLDCWSSNSENLKRLDAFCGIIIRTPKTTK